MITSTCECPKCGGLPLDPRVVNVESDALFRVETGAAVFRYPGERDVNWALERELSAPDNGLITVTCFDCDHRWTTEAPARRFDSDAAFNRATHLMKGARYDEARDCFLEILDHAPRHAGALNGMATVTLQTRLPTNKCLGYEKTRAVFAVFSAYLDCIPEQ